ncbi:MAG: hypothetical protein P8Y63_01930 [Deltaproteobacteria bacterium]
MMTRLTCWQCGAVLKDLPLPLGRSAECLQCRAELRTCRQCEFYDSRANRQCREPQADPVQEKGRANFCDWFRPRQTEQEGGGVTGGARADLDALFGNTAGPSSPHGEKEARQALDRLFGKK